MKKEDIMKAFERAVSLASAEYPVPRHVQQKLKNVFQTEIILLDLRTNTLKKSLDHE